MSVQDKAEKIMRELHVALSKGENVPKKPERFLSIIFSIENFAKKSIANLRIQLSETIIIHSKILSFIPVQKYFHSSFIIASLIP